MKKIIIFHISQLGGHKKAAENIKEALEYKAPSLNIFSLNIFDYISPLLEKKVNFFYGLTIRYFPQLWGKFYDRKGVIKTLAPLQKIINRYALSKIHKLINKINPSLILTTQAFPCGIIADFKRIFNFNIPLIGVVTDYYPHRFWLYPEVDFYTVASQEAKEILIKEGIEEGKIEKLVEEALKVFWSEIGLEFDPEVKNIVAKLKEKYRLCVASDEFRKGLEMKLNKVFGDWKKYFEFIVSAEDAGELKPSKRFCEIPLEKFGFGPEDVIFVGDSWERDLEEAHKMNMKTVLVREEKEGNPDFWIKKITDIENVLNV